MERFAQTQEFLVLKGISQEIILVKHSLFYLSNIKLIAWGYHDCFF